MEGREYPLEEPAGASWEWDDNSVKELLKFCDEENLGLKNLGLEEVGLVRTLLKEVAWVFKTFSADSFSSTPNMWRWVTGCEKRGCLSSLFFVQLLVAFISSIDCKVIIHIHSDIISSDFNSKYAKKKQQRTSKSKNICNNKHKTSM